MNVIKQMAKVGIGLVASLFLLTGCSKKVEDANLLAGMELVEQYDFQGALEKFDEALLNDEDMQLCYRGQGIAYMGLGNYADAETAFLKSIENAKHTFSVASLEYDINYYLASVYMKQGKYADAEKIYSAIIALRKKDIDAYYLRACAILRQNRYDEAIQDFEKAFSLDTKNLDLVTDAYVEMQAAGYENEGKEYVKKFMKDNDKNLKEQQKGVMYFYLEDYENARIYLDAFINGDDPNISTILGQTYEKLGNMDYAATVYQTYLSSHDPNAGLYNSLGICLMNQAKYTEAIGAFEAGIAMGNSDYLQELRFNLIVAKEYNRDFEQAKNLMKEYLQIYPDDAVAKRENEFLQSR